MHAVVHRAGRHGPLRLPLAARRLAPAVALCVVISVVMPVAAVGAQAAPDRGAGVRPAHEVRTVHTAELGMESPRGIVYDPESAVLTLAGEAEGETPVIQLSPAEDRLESSTLPDGEPLTLALDEQGQDLAMVAGRDLLTVPEDELSEPRPSPERTALQSAGLRDPAGAVFDATGALLVLDAGSRAIVRVEGADPGGGVTRTPLANLGGVTLRGLALNPGDGLLYVGSPEEGLVYAVDDGGEVQIAYDLEDGGPTDQQDLVFAPSADPTDDPEQMSLFVVDGGDADSGGGVVEMSLTAPTALAEDPVTATLVQTIDTSQWNPPSPDPAGIVYFSHTDRLFVSDSEVNEMTIFQGVNLYETTRTGELTGTGVTTAFSNEPTGLGYRASDDTLFISDDTGTRRIFIVKPGPDGRHGTPDDQVTSFTTRPNSDDPEDVAYDPVSGDLFIVDGVGREVYRVSAGPDGAWGTGDDVWSSFDVEQYGARDPEGIDYDPERDNLLMVDQRSRAVYELTRDGALVRIIDIQAASSVAAAGVTLAPGSQRPERMNLWVVARGVDNGADPDENDGKLHELSFGSGDNTPPVVTRVVIDQSEPQTDDTLTVSVTAHDDDGDDLTYTYRWRKNGVTLPGETNPTLDLSVPGNGDEGDAISVRVTALDGQAESDQRTSSQVTIVPPPSNPDNTPPVVTKVRIDQSEPQTDDTLTVSVTAHDDDGDDLTYTYRWRKNGVTLPGETNPTLDLSVPGNGDEGDAISVRVTALDGQAESDQRTSSQVTIVPPPSNPDNTPPVVTKVRIDQSEPQTDDTLTVSVTAHDDDGDDLTYTYRWRKNGVTLPGETNPTLDLSVPGNGDEGDAISVRVTAFDGEAESDPRTSWQVTIVP